MEHYQLILTYDGTDFEGFQRQGRKRTVQRVLEKALKELGWNEKTILSAGRTDTGVHASGQVIAFSLNWKHPLEKMLHALNAKLPGDVAVQRILQVPQAFHPRFDARARKYLYRIFIAPERDPLRERFEWRLDHELDLSLMNRAAATIIGCHDFSAIGKAMKPGASTVRTILSAKWQKEAPNSFQFEIMADAFLYHMVRRLVFLLVRIGMGRLDTSELVEAIEHGKKILPGLAPACGLCLESVFYEDQDLCK